MSKKLKLILCLTLMLFTLTGCKDKEVGILFNAEPITKDNVLHASKTFEAGKRIYYLFYSHPEIKSQFIRVQVFKAGDTVAKGGYSIRWTGDYRIMKQNHYYYYNYFVLHEPGRYVMQLFSIDNLSIPLAWDYFYVR